MVNYLRLLFVSLFAVVSLVLGNATALADESPTLVAGTAYAHAGFDPVVIAKIAPPGYSFSGTLISKSSLYGGTDILSVYVDKSRVLWINQEGTSIPTNPLKRASDTSYTLAGIAKITFEPSDGNLAIGGIGEHWFEGSITGMYTTNP